MAETKYLTFTSLGRKQSPTLENIMQDRLGEMFCELMERKGLYQNLRVDEDYFTPYEDSEYPRAKLFAEFQKRPIHPVSRGEDQAKDGIGGMFACGGRALGTPGDELPMAFFLPVVRTECRTCKEERPFLSLQSIDLRVFNTPYPILGERTKQAYTLDYRCSDCRAEVVSFLLLRNGLKFQMVGRTEPFRPKLEKIWPKEIIQIIQDAITAQAENDLPAAYYHLRTGIEFFIKNHLGKHSAEKIEGAELCEQYNRTLDKDLLSRFPSFAELYEKLSRGIHTREVNAADFEKYVKSFADHLKAKKLFDEYKPASP